MTSEPAKGKMVIAWLAKDGREFVIGRCRCGPYMEDENGEGFDWEAPHGFVKESDLPEAEGEAARSSEGETVSKK